MLDTVWVVGEDTGTIIGVFSTENTALAEAKKVTHYFVAPVTLNQLCPDKDRLLAGAYYPALQTHPTLIGV